MILIRKLVEGTEYKLHCSIASKGSHRDDGVVIFALLFVGRSLGPSRYDDFLYKSSNKSNERLIKKLFILKYP